MSAICGIVGKYAASDRSDQDLAAMLAAMEARGPDGVEAQFDGAQGPWGACLGFRQLKVQPDEPRRTVIANEDETLLLICDGQVFNYDELAGWLKAKGHTLRSADPCEVMVHLYEEEGPDGWRRVDGQFGLALWDRRKQQLVLGRDFLGVRAVYYHASSEGVLFASEIKSLLQHPKAPSGVDEIAVSHYLTFMVVPGPRTLFAGISKLPAGTAAIIGRDGAVQLKKFWDLLDNPIPEVEDERFYVDRVRELHKQAVARREISGPVAALVSGGNDSSANAVLMARDGCAPLHTFTVGLAELEGHAKYNDMEYARQVAQLIKSEHHEAYLTTDDFLATLPHTVDAMDDLISEPSAVFLYHALRMVKDQGLRVVVTGEANDEISCGHGEMMRIREGYYRRWQPLMRLPAFVRRAAAAAAPLISPKHEEILGRAASGEEFFWNFEIAWMESQKPQILSHDAWERCRKESAGDVAKRYANQVRASEHGKRDYMNHMIYLMMQDYYFQNCMLGKLDLLASGLGLEPRCPYTAPDYAHFVFNIPAQFKAKDGTVKYFFKKAIEGVLPDSIIYRPKQGFRTPVVELFQGALGDWAKPVLLEQGLTRTGFLRRDHLDQLLTRHRQGGVDYSYRLWTAMMLNLWHERWIRPGRSESAAPAGSVRTLTARMAECAARA